MESSSDIVRLNEESSDGWEIAWNDYESDSADSWKTQEFVTLSFKKLLEKQAKLKDTEDKNYKLESLLPNLKWTELRFPSITNCKTVVTEKVHENQINCVNEKRLVIVNKKGLNYDNNQQFDVNSRFKRAAEYEIPENIGKTPKAGDNPEKNSHAKHKGEIRRNPFFHDRDFKVHSNAVPDHSKPFECDICHKSFGDKRNLKRHVSAVHFQSKPFDCEICHTSFGYKCVLKTHISTVHNRIKPFECEICHKSFEQKVNLKRHLNVVHNRSKPFECEDTLIESFDCEICCESIGSEDGLKMHLNTRHGPKNAFECDICHESFGMKNDVKRHKDLVHYCENPFRM